MALRELVEGDCGGPGPLAGFASHLVQDRGFREEGIGHPREVPLERATADQLVDEFLEGRGNAHPGTFRMNTILQQVQEIDHGMQHPLPPPSMFKEQDSEWANQFLNTRTEFFTTNADQIWSENALPRLPLPESNELGLGVQWAEDYFEHTLETSKKDEEKLKSLDDTITENPNIAYSKFMKFMHQEGDITSDVTEHNSASALSSKWSQEFAEQKEEAEKSLGNLDGVLNKVEEELAVAGSWTNEFLKSPGNVGTDTYESSFWSKFEGEWDKAAKSHITDPHPWLSDYESYYDPFKDYKFKEDNPMKDVPDALEQGKSRLEAGDLPSAVLCFEAAVQQNEENPEAWFLLGKTQAENEQDPLAIAALKKSLTLDTSNASALMTLAVSYTNESYQNQACLTLKEWLLKNEKYRHLLVRRNSTENAPKSSVSTILFDDVHNEVKDLFIQAARMNPTEGIDADVQSGLGVLFNLSSEYDKATDCFRAALQVRPDDSRLWNRLGATLANGQRSEEAVDAYSRALELSPGFIRARYNLGISCINLGAYKEAAEHLLTALNQQAAGRGVQGENNAPHAMSETIWSTLRLVVSLMHKYHLTEAVEKWNLAKLNEEFEIS
ncbi:peroxisomal targeting signal 1 receptor [Diachasmimorpha longicaudata]|uniref:peroxisomal targeting signal 1 receptor n=1 Tax=Diachasmimorpha longicaudata TaxID=58733 RepID=UPI0030B915FC